MASLDSALAHVDASTFTLQADGTPLPQTSAPGIITALLRLLDVRPGDRVLEIGTGSGYTTAVLASLVGDSGHVTSIDVNPTLTARARALIDAASVVLVSSDGAYGHPPAAPFDRVIAWATPTVIPKAWTDQTRHGGRIVTPVKIAPVASANLTVAASVRDSTPTDLRLHAGSFVDMTPRDVPQHLPAYFLDALLDDGDAPAWLSAVALRGRPEVARAFLHDLVRRPRTETAPFQGDDLSAVLAHLAANRPDDLAAAFTPLGRGIGYATAGSVALLVEGVLVSVGTGEARDLLRARLDEWRDRRPRLDDMVARCVPVDGGWRVVLSPDWA